MTGPGERMRERAAEHCEGKATESASMRNAVLRTVAREIRALPSGDWESEEEVAAEIGDALERHGVRATFAACVGAARAVMEGPKR